MPIFQCMLILIVISGEQELLRIATDHYDMITGILR